MQSKQLESPSLGIASKITLIALSFSLPIGVLVYLMVASINANITVARLEQTGNAYLRPLVDTLARVQDHQLAAAKCAPTRVDCSAELNPLKQKVEEAFRSLADVDARHGVDLKFTSEELAKRGRSQQTLTAARAQWTAIAANSSASPEQYTQLASGLRTMIAHAGDTSNLILDPDLDSYYLMDATLVALPQTIDRMATVTAETGKLLSNPSSAEARRIQTAISASQLAGDRQHVVDSSQTSLNEDANFYGPSPSLTKNLPPALKNYIAAGNRFEGLTRKISQGSAVDPNEYQKASADARQAALSYWHLSVDELDKLLDARARSYESSRTTSLAWSGLALLIASGLAFFMARSITAPLTGLMRSLGPGATLLGECVNRISDVSKSKTVDPLEAQIICGELDAHANSMREAVLALARQVSGSAAEESALQTNGGRS